jgi:Txe/YoeB family toxin of Txe-Axe toxin-antitoxin module
MNNDFELIKVQANYSDIELLLNETMRFSYEVTLLYGDINNDLIEKYARRITEKSYQTYMSGNINDSEGKHKIIINGNYSDVD